MACEKFVKGQRVFLNTDSKFKEFIGILGTIDKVVPKADGFYCVEFDRPNSRGCNYVIGLTDNELQAYLR